MKFILLGNHSSIVQATTYWDDSYSCKFKDKGTYLCVVKGTHVSSENYSMILMKTTFKGH